MSDEPASQQPPKDAASWEERIEAGDVKFGDVVVLRAARGQKIDDDSSSEQIERRALGVMFYEKALDAFKKVAERKAEVIAGETEVAIFSAGCGTYVSPDGRFWYTIVERAVEFDWSCAGPLLARVQGLYDRSAEIWPVPIADSSPEDNPGKPPESETGDERQTSKSGGAQKKQPKSPEPNSTGSRFSKRNPWSWWRLRSMRRRTTERDPHARRAYQLCSSLFSAINLEKLYRTEQSESGKALTREPSESFEKRVWMVSPEIAEAEATFERAAQRYARGRYSQGMVLGVVAIGLFCGALAIAFNIHHVPAWYGVAVLAGGVGAIVSVLQRMASGKLKLEYDAGDSTLIILGAVRPLVGAIFGTVLFCAINGGWLPAVKVETHHELAFYAVLGFLAGFNERFAQDMLVASAGQLAHRAFTPETDLQWRRNGSTEQEQQK